MDERMDGKPPKRTLIPHPVFTGGPAPARTYASREIYNLTGNVREWCMDVYAPYLRYPTEVLEVTPDPKMRSMRGGSWRTSGWDCRSSRRFKANASETFDDVGFRIVCK
jgi:formylglycine-generating enzyme required for sulfatase activity